MCTSSVKGIILPAGNATGCAVPTLSYFRCSHGLFPLPGTLSLAFASLCFVFQAWMSLLYGYFWIFRSSLLFILFPLCYTYHRCGVSLCWSMYFCSTGFPLALQALRGQVPCFLPQRLGNTHQDAQREKPNNTLERIHPWFIEDCMLTKISFKFKDKNTNLVLKTWLKPTE